MKKRFSGSVVPPAATKNENDCHEGFHSSKQKSKKRVFPRGCIAALQHTLADRTLPNVGPNQSAGEGRSGVGTPATSLCGQNRTSHLGTSPIRRGSSTGAHTHTHTHTRTSDTKATSGSDALLKTKMFGRKQWSVFSDRAAILINTRML